MTDDRGSYPLRIPRKIALHMSIVFALVVTGVSLIRGIVRGNPGPPLAMALVLGGVTLQVLRAKSFGSVSRDGFRFLFFIRFPWREITAARMTSKGLQLTVRGTDRPLELAAVMVDDDGFRDAISRYAPDGHPILAALVTSLPEAD